MADFTGIGSNSAGIPLTNSGPFLNVAPLAHIWYATEETPSIAFAFRFSDGDTMTASKDNQFYAWAVRDGDVTPVPEPGTILLVGSGLIGLVGFRRRRLRKSETSIQRAASRAGRLRKLYLEQFHLQYSQNLH